MIGDALDVRAVPFEIDVLTGERTKAQQIWIDRLIPLCPIIDSLTSDEDIGHSLLVANLKNCRKIMEGKTHGYAHFAMARAT